MRLWLGRTAGRACIGSLLALLLLIPTQALGGKSEDRERYREAREALASGEEERFRSLLGELHGYALEPYLVHADLSRRLASAGDGELRSFFDSHPELAVTDDLRARWLKLLADRERWAEFLADYRPQRSVELRCLALKARLQLGGSVALEDGHRDLWLHGRSRPDACNPVFAHWRKQGLLSEDLYYQRAQLAIEAGELRLASWLSRSLPRARREELERWMRLRRAPLAGLEQARHWPDEPLNRRMLTSELLRLSRQDAERALNHWQRLADRFAWERHQQAEILRSIQLLRATDYPDDAQAALASLPADAVDLQIREWRVRVALHGDDWAAVLEALEGLPAEAQDRDRWRYWRARALAETGDAVGARALYGELAVEANYYGFLAAERLGQPYALCPRLREADLDAMGRLATQPAMERAIELFHVDQLHDARREWNRAVAGLDAEARRQAALLASAEGWHGRAVLTLANAGFLRQYSVRFPLAWAEQVQAEAGRRGLNPSLVYAVMRSESALVEDAVSGAGARGLMQLTPDTGRAVARRFGLAPPSRRALLEGDRSIALGSAYLAQLFEELGHPLLVLAAYNAGPEAVKRWQAQGMPEAADRWIETLPYHETREYLPRVLAFATIYDWRRHGRMVPLSIRMPDLDARPGVTDLAARSTIRPVCAQSTHTRLSQQ